MEESIFNIGLTKEKLPDPKFLKQTPNSLIGKYCKIAFPHKNNPQRKEYMWVKATDTDDECELKGVLNNDPLFATQVKCGDVIKFNRKEIIETCH